MARTVEFYFSLISPWVYVGDRVFRDIARRHGLKVDYRPASLGTLFANTGGLPLGQRHAARQAYRWVELQRWREARGIEMNLQPAHWPFASPVPDHVIMAVQDRGIDPAPLLSRMMRALWVEEKDLADEGVLAALIADEGLPAEEILAAARTPEMAERHAANTARAAELGVFGSPSVVLDGEVFWGQDRYDLLDAALKSGRPPFRPL